MIAAIVLQIILLLYHGLTSMVDFYPFNGVRFRFTREYRAARIAHYGDSIVNVVLMALAPLGFVLGAQTLMRFGIAYYLVLIGVQIAFWWVPFFLGPSRWWLDHYTKIHRETITVLPRGNNPVPNLEHLTLQIVIALTTLVTWFAYRAIPSAEFPRPFWRNVFLVGAVLVGLTLVKNVGRAGQENPKSRDAQ